MTKPYYDLPPERIAQEPPAIRGDSRLLIVDRLTGALTDRRYGDLVEYLEPGDVLVVNDTKVMPARLVAQLPDGRTRELMLTERHHQSLPPNQALVVHRGKIRVGDELRVGDERVRVLEVRGGGQAIIESATPLEQLADRHGATPLPPYIRREATATDRERYQTIFAASVGSVAAPTASLNLTDDLLRKIADRGVEVVRLTLHVGRGTFLPVRTEQVEQHTMHEEYFQIPAATVKTIRAAKRGHRRVIAIGTTVTRALEYAADDILRGDRQDIAGEADIFIYPGYRFEIVDSLLTNFHAPESTVIQLAAAFVGEGLLKRAYQHALAQDYKFLSYGDSMLIV